MRFSIATIAAFAALTNALSIPRAEVASIGVTLSGSLVNGVFVAGPDPDDTTTTTTTRDLITARDAHASIEKREIIMAIAVIAGTAAITELSTKAVDAALAEIQSISADWTAAREKFTQATTASMWAKNPNPAAYPGVACYNMGYKLKNDNVEGKINAKLTSGVLNTDYDCMYVGKGNAFYTQGDGGYINLSYRYSSGCSYDGSTGDLSC